MGSENEGAKDTAQKATETTIEGENSLRVLAQQLTELHETEVTLTKRGSEDEAAVMVLPVGRRVVSMLPFLEEQREKPKRIRGRAKLAAPESFIEHVKRFKEDNTAIFADVLSSPPKLVARYDYHDKGDPRWQEHSAQYDFPLSKEWEAWCKQDGEGRMMSMETFAFFLEQRIIDVLHPTTVEDKLVNEISSLLQIDWATPQQLLQLSKSLHVNTESKLTEVTDTQGGKKNFSFTERDSDAKGQDLVLPGGFLIRVSVFEGSTPWVIPVLLRYRKPGGKAHFFYEIYRRDVHLMESMRETCARVSKETDVPLFYGKPEASQGLGAKTEVE